MAEPRRIVSPRSLNAIDGRLYFIATDSRGDGLYTSDGTPAGTRRLDDLSPGLVEVGMVAVDGRLVYPAYSADVGLELFAVDLHELAANVPVSVERHRVEAHEGGFRLRLRSRDREQLRLPPAGSRGDPRAHGARVRVLDARGELLEELPLDASAWSLNGGGRRLAYSGAPRSRCERIAIHEGQRLDLDCMIGASEIGAVEIWLGSAPSTRYSMSLGRRAESPEASKGPRGRRR